MTEKLLDVQNIDVYYGGIHALHGVSMHVNAGEIVSIIGANGAGKSTTMRTIVGEKKVTSGEIWFNGAPLPRHEHEVVRSGISLVPEGRRIFSGLTVRENLMVGTWPRKGDKAGAAQDLEEVLTLFPRLRERIRQTAGTLSGGEQQMLAVGRALMSRPKLLCLDEPSLGLAPIVIDEMFGRIVEINKKRGQTILLVEQNAFLALEVADRAYVIKTGEIVMEGTGEQLLNDPSVQESYLGISES
ncbi:MAG: ABC transporter ATP-binding protein [Lawsonibacter sp.]|jgi:branched-chain amino acid transport system ATP-binding protein|nr:ABC transporter ATP-binding protein [Lawsonibacter sp.]